MGGGLRLWEALTVIIISIIIIIMINYSTWQANGKETSGSRKYKSNI